jgi:hypothetical protein
MDHNELPLQLLKIETNSLLWAADITAYTGKTASLAVSVQIRTNWSTYYTQFAAAAFDDITFSPELVPERVPPQNAGLVQWGENFGAVPIPPNVSNVTAIAVGGYHRGALSSDGTLNLWGDPMDFKTLVPPEATNIVSFAAGQEYTLALRRDGRVIAWPERLVRYTPTSNTPPNLTNAIAVAAGSGNSLALLAGGTVSAWGNPDPSLWGEVGGVPPTNSVPPGLSNIVAIAAGGIRNLVLNSSGSVLSWGWGGRGLTNEPLATNVVAIAAGGLHSIALRADGSVVAWGDDTYGQTNVPPDLTNVVAIAAGDYHSLALLSDGTVRGWGNNAFGQITIPLGLTNVIAIAAGGAQSMSLLGAGPPSPFVRATAVRINDAQLHITIPTQCGHTYRLEKTTDLSNPHWTPFPLAGGNGGELELSTTASESQAFYRVRGW